MDNIKTLFTALYGHQFKKPYNSVIECPFDDYFNRQIQELEKQLGKTSTSSAPVQRSPESTATSNDSDYFDDSYLAPPVPTLRKTAAQRQAHAIDSDATATSTEVSPIPTPDSSRPATPNTSVVTSKTLGPGGRASRRARKAANTSAPISRDGSASKLKALEKGTKHRRKWDIDGGALDDDGIDNLDYSTTSLTSDAVQPDGGAVPSVTEVVDQSTWGKKDRSGAFVLKDLDEEMSSILASAKSSAPTPTNGAPNNNLLNRTTSSLTSAFANLVGGKTLTQEDLKKPLQSMQDHLIRKNVARDAAEHLCAAVERDLTGTKTASFTSFDATVRQSMDTALSKILTPASGSSLDLLRAVQSVRGKRPYVLSLVGVNGVGKSTTLAKLAFLLLHNDLKVLVAAADTFRSGAVEQLRVHVSRLQRLTSQQDGVGSINLFEKGYGKDAAAIAKEAVATAKTGGYDVVLVDTAGRRHNDSRLMSSLSVFARQAQPDKVLLVCEALVGTDSVAQAQHFNESFGGGRGEKGIDGFIVSKCDTVGGMVGTLVSLVWSTGVPVVAVGVGQHYGDLRGFKVAWARELLLSG